MFRTLDQLTREKTSSTKENCDCNKVIYSLAGQRWAKVRALSCSECDSTETDSDALENGGNTQTMKPEPMEWYPRNFNEFREDLYRVYVEELSKGEGTEGKWMQQVDLAVEEVIEKLKKEMELSNAYVEVEKGRLVSALVNFLQQLEIAKEIEYERRRELKEYLKQHLEWKAAKANTMDIEVMQIMPITVTTTVKEFKRRTLIKPVKGWKDWEEEKFRSLQRQWRIGTASRRAKYHTLCELLDNRGITRLLGIKSLLFAKYQYLKPCEGESFRIMSELLQHDASVSSENAKFVEILDSCSQATSSVHKKGIFVITNSRSEAENAMMEKLVKNGHKVVFTGDQIGKTDEQPLSKDSDAKTIANTLLHSRKTLLNMDKRQNIARIFKQAVSNFVEMVDQLEKTADALICDAETAMLLNNVMHHLRRTLNPGKTQIGRNCDLVAVEMDPCTVYGDLENVKHWWRVPKAEALEMARFLQDGEDILCSAVGGSLFVAAARYDRLYARSSEQKPLKIVIFVPGCLTSRGGMDYYNYYDDYMRNPTAKISMECFHYWWHDIPLTDLDLPFAVICDLKTTVKEALESMESAGTQCIALICDPDVATVGLATFQGLRNWLLSNTRADPALKYAHGVGKRKQRNPFKDLAIHRLRLKDIIACFDRDVPVGFDDMTLLQTAGKLQVCRSMFIIERSAPKGYSAKWPQPVVLGSSTSWFQLGGHLVFTGKIVTRNHVIKHKENIFKEQINRFKISNFGFPK